MEIVIFSTNRQLEFLKTLSMKHKNGPFLLIFWLLYSTFFPFLFPLWYFNRDVHSNLLYEGCAGNKIVLCLCGILESLARQVLVSYNTGKLYTANHRDWTELWHQHHTVLWVRSRYAMLCTFLSITKTQKNESSEKTAAQRAPDHRNNDMFAWAPPFCTPVKSRPFI